MAEISGSVVVALLREVHHSTRGDRHRSLHRPSLSLNSTRARRNHVLDHDPRMASRQVLLGYAFDQRNKSTVGRISDYEALSRGARSSHYGCDYECFGSETDRSTLRSIKLRKLALPSSSHNPGPECEPENWVAGRAWRVKKMEAEVLACKAIERQRKRLSAASAMLQKNAA